MLDIMQFPDPEAFLQAFRHFQESEMQYQGDAQTLNAGHSTLSESWQGDGATAYSQSHNQMQQAGQMHQEQRQQVAAMLSSTVAPLGEAQMLQDTAMGMMEESDMLTAQAAVEAADPFTAPAAAATEAAAAELAAQAQMTQASAQAIVQGVCANWAATLQEMMGTMSAGMLGNLGGVESGGNESGSPTNNADPLIQELQSTPRGREALDVQNRYNVSVNTGVPGEGSYYNPATNSVTLDPLLPDHEKSNVFVHEMNHAEYAQTGRSADISTFSRNDYVDGMLNEETDGQVKAIQNNIQRGNSTPTLLQPEYEQAYQDGVNALRAQNPSATPSQLAQAGEEAGRQRVRDGFVNGDVVASTSGDTYSDFYGNAWDRVHPQP